MKSTKNTSDVKIRATNTDDAADIYEIYISRLFVSGHLRFLTNLLKPSRNGWSLRHRAY